MYELDDTIVAVSSPTAGQRAIVRITGPRTVESCEQIFQPSIRREKRMLMSGSIVIDSELRIDARLYLFLAPHSYTGDDVAEIHIHTNPSVTEALMGDLLGKGLRMAGPGEFTARAYFNGKVDLAQAEAVNEIIVSSNKYQLAAAEKLLGGRLAETTRKVCSELLNYISQLEAGLDFGHEDIELITREEAADGLTRTKQQLEQLLAGSISYEAVIDMPAVGIAGAPNAGKSSLLNRLLGKERSIVSDRQRTTRDVLTGLLTLQHCSCVLFDCAGLDSRFSILDSGERRASGIQQQDILDELAQAAAIEALGNSSVVIFCVDLSKPDWAEDIAIRQLIGPKALIAVATKSDLLLEDELVERLARLNDLLDADFSATSAKTDIGITMLKDTIDRHLVEQASGNAKQDSPGAVALTARHRQAVTDAIKNVSESISELKAGNDEVTAMLLRAAYQAISDIERQNIDEQILDAVFSRFCIGK